MLVPDRILRSDSMLYIYPSCSSVLSPPASCEVARIHSQRNKSGDLALYVFFRVIREIETQRRLKRFTQTHLTEFRSYTWQFEIL